MQSADESRVCRYPVPRNPNGVCGRVLAGQGRYKWCPLHSGIVRQERRRAQNAGWQRAWRARRSLTYHNRRWIGRHVDVLHRRLMPLSQWLCDVDSRLAYWRLLADLEEHLQHATALGARILTFPMLPRGYDVFVPLILSHNYNFSIEEPFLGVVVQGPRNGWRDYKFVWLHAPDSWERRGVEREKWLIRRIIDLAVRHRWLRTEGIGLAIRMPRLARLLKVDELYYFRISEKIAGLAPRSVPEKSKRNASLGRSVRGRAA